MNTAHIVTPWIGTGAAGDAFRPQLADDYAVDWQDITGQQDRQLIPAPNAYTLQVTCDDATLAAIQADANYVVLFFEVVVMQ